MRGKERPYNNQLSSVCAGLVCSIVVPFTVTLCNSIGYYIVNAITNRITKSDVNGLCIVDAITIGITFF
jgi:hypothetical protein